jgi:hypothetical protein
MYFLYPHLWLFELLSTQKPRGLNQFKILGYLQITAYFTVEYTPFQIYCIQYHLLEIFSPELHLFIHP